MPTYVYVCENEGCNGETDYYVSLEDFDDTATMECGECGGEAKRVISARQVTHTSWSSWQD